MMFRSTALTAIAALSLVGCSTHPLPEDVTGHDTYELVQKIRCETRDALRAITIEYLRNGDSATPRSERFAGELEAQPVRFETLKASDFDKENRNLFVKYSNTTVGFFFKFDIARGNAHTFGFGLSNPFTNGTRSAAIDTSLELKRSTYRTFRTASTFEDLIKLEEEICRYGPSRSRVVYPFGGKIGVDEMILTFVKLNEWANLVAKEKGNVPELTDTFSFTTTTKASVDPSFAAKAVTSGLGLASLTQTNSVQRTDIHEVSIALVLDSLATAPRQTAAIANKSLGVARAFRALDRQEVQRDSRAFRQELEALQE